MQLESLITPREKGLSASPDRETRKVVCPRMKKSIFQNKQVVPENQNNKGCLMFFSVPHKLCSGLNF